MRRPSTSRNRPRVGAPTQRAGSSHRGGFFGLVLTAMLAGGCAEEITKHGYLFHESDLTQVQPGMGPDQVRMALGTPTTTTTSGNGSAYYYISSTEAKTSFLTPKETDRQVVAVYFNPTGTVDHVANYGMKDGKVFDFVSRTTPAPGGRDEGLLKQLFRNLGKKQIFGDG